MSATTVFAKILDGELPCHRVYEDEHVLAFLDVNPMAQGHLLVIPKERRAHLHELSPEQSAAIGRVLPMLARALMQATGAHAYNVLQNNGADAGQEVMHAHFHLIPRRGSHGLRFKGSPRPLDQATAPDLARRIADAIA
ncbi:MAG: HIT family protein [Myxococcota bacterium]